jgi:tungstate transport system substrate-binding protein
MLLNIDAISNGGAGATGLLQMLSGDYRVMRGQLGSISWVCNHSRNTQLALLYNYIDMALTYERDQETIAEKEGWSKTLGCVFHDHFVLAGPMDDPAHLAAASSLEDALRRIAESQCVFHSRADLSATMWMERSLWKLASLKPWTDPAATWYKTSRLSPAEAVIVASVSGAYLVTDRSTLLRQTRLKTIRDITVFFEPTSPDSILMNSCYASISTAAARDPSHGLSFFEYVCSPRGQRVVQEYGMLGDDGMSLFAGLDDGFARAPLRNGQPVDGLWLPAKPADEYKLNIGA